MKRIALIRSTYSPFGGVERVALGLATELLRTGAQVTLLTFPAQSWPIQHPNLNVIPMGLFRTHRLVQAWSFNRAVIHHLTQTSYDCIFSLDRVTTCTHLHAGGGTHKTFLRLKDGYSGPAARLLRRISPFHQYILYLERKGFQSPRLKRVRCNSTMVKADIVREYGVSQDKLSVIHSGIRWQDMAEVFACRELQNDQLRTLHGLDKSWKCLLFLGSGFVRKGLDIAIQGLGAMPGDYHLVVVGKGAPGPHLRLARHLGLEHRVHFIGPQPRGWRYAAVSKALVLPSYYDPFGGAAAEGHAMGIPVLVSDTTGYADWVRPGENGVILENPMTTQRIARAFADLADLINHPRCSADQLRQHARALDDSVILEKLLADFLEV